MDLDFAGPTHSPGASCSVLRCGGADDVYVLRLPRFGGETLVCAPHHDAMLAGEPWSWDSEDGKFLMGADRTGDGRLVAVDAEVTQRTDGDSTLGWRTLAIDFEDEDGRTRRVTMSHDIAKNLAKGLRIMTGSDSD